MIPEGDNLALSLTVHRGTMAAGHPRPTGVASLGLRERRRLERDLHDGAQQRLVSLALTLRIARETLDSDPGETGLLLDRSREELDQALRELRELAAGIHPAVLADRGLGAAVEALAERARLCAGDTWPSSKA